jgi:hypothetical protein
MLKGLQSCGYVISNGGTPTWLRKENQVAEQRANPENPAPSNAQSVGELYLPTRQSDIQREFLLWILSLLENSGSRAAIFRPER